MQPATATRNHRAAEPTKHRAYQDHARYNQANQRVFVRNGNTVTYYLYGLGGERLMEFQETCTGGACGSYTETQRWIYFAGRKMFSKTGTTLKAITPDRLASEAKHFPYGETDGPPPSDSKDYFATYRRDGTGLDYAWNRYYSPTMGRFTTPDPYGGSVDPGLPETWNRYSYVGIDPVNRTDSTGLLWDPFSLMQGPVLGDWGAGPFSVPDIWGLPWSVPFGLPQPDLPGLPQPDLPGMVDLPSFMQRTAEDRRRKEDEILKALAKVARSRSGRGVGVMPMYLKVTDPKLDDYYECWMGNAVLRNVVYQLFGADKKKLFGFDIKEHLWNTETDSPVVTESFSRPNRKFTGLFHDMISVGTGFPKKYLQWFTVTGITEGGLPLVDFPVFIEGWGQQYGLLYKEKTRTEVTINGNEGRVIQCN
jgi:RHS repeat-associated protein